MEPPTGGTENYVALNPIAGELSIPSLMGTLGALNVAPSVSITSPANGSGFITGAVVAIAATAADADGTVSSVEFLLMVYLLELIIHRLIQRIIQAQQDLIV
ncbi:MAG: hypothetical protein IPI62_15010 [Bacteroidetes bacterium]|nr:hypothetical protein [Bacteroidota bacterium]